MTCQLSTLHFQNICCCFERALCGIAYRDVLLVWKLFCLEFRLLYIPSLLGLACLACRLRSQQLPKRHDLCLGKWHRSVQLTIAGLAIRPCPVTCAFGYTNSSPQLTKSTTRHQGFEICLSTRTQSLGMVITSLGCLDVAAGCCTNAYSTAYFAAVTMAYKTPCACR